MLFSPLFSLLVGVLAFDSSLEAEVMESIQHDVTEHKVMLYSKTYCRYSKKIKTLLHHYILDDIKTIELNLQPLLREMLHCLEQLSGIHTVPQLFVNGSFVGGYTDTQKLEDQGELRRIFESAGAL